MLSTGSADDDAFTPTVRFVSKRGNSRGRETAFKQSEALRTSKPLNFKGKMARPKRFELLTPRFVVWCSIQLSYGRACRYHGEAAE